MANESPRVVMLSAEAYPYAKVGGLGDVVGALPRVLESLGARITLAIPAYKAIEHDRFGIRIYSPVAGFEVPMGPGSVRAEIFHTRMPGSEIDVFFIGCPEYFLRDGIYDDPVWGEGFLDNMQRYVFFCKAALELLPRLGVEVDVLHCHDWQAALVPGLLKYVHDQDPFYARSGTLLTIHNVAYQGVYPRETLYWAGIDYRHVYPNSPFEFWSRVNLLKAGIECADKINTVSATYAKEIQSTAEYGCGLEGVLHSRSADVCGIVNGIDYRQWDPETDPCLPAHYSAFDMSGKPACKAELLKEFGLPAPHGRVPLIGMVSRLTEQKGFDLIEAAIDEIISLDLQLVLLGIGQQRYQDMMKRISALYPDRVALRLGYDDRLAHLIFAGSDMILMPSRYEPCGLNQLYALRYGTVPVVRATGGLADTVVDFSRDPDRGSGFSFENYSAGEMVVAIKRALVVYSSQTLWGELTKRDMIQNWSWEESARHYVQLYRKICSMREGRNSAESDDPPIPPTSPQGSE